MEAKSFWEMSFSTLMGLRKKETQFHKSSESQPRVTNAQQSKHHDALAKKGERGLHRRPTEPTRVKKKPRILI